MAVVCFVLWCTKTKPYRIYGQVAVVMAVGFSLAQGYGHHIFAATALWLNDSQKTAAELHSDLKSGYTQVVGEVTEIRTNNYGQSFKVTISQINGESVLSLWQPALLQVFAANNTLVREKSGSIEGQINDNIKQETKSAPVDSAKPELKPLFNTVLEKGAEVVIVAKLKPIVGLENRYGFDNARWQFANRVTFKTSLNDPKQIQVINLGQSYMPLAKLKQTLLLMTQGHFIVTLLFGDKSELTRQDRLRLKHWGVSHLFAISGLHIGILMAVIVYSLKGLFAVVRCQSSVAGRLIISLMIVWCYVVLIGLPISATRAALMLTIYILIRLSAWYISPLNVIALAIVFSLIIAPNNVLQPAWWLSFCAVICLVFLFQAYLKPGEDSQAEQASTDPKNGSMWRCWPQLALKWLKALVLLQVGLTLLMLPLTLYWLEGIAPSAIINNLIVLPMFSLLLVPMLFLSVIIYPLSSELGFIGFHVANEILTAIWHILETIPYNDHWLELNRYYAGWLTFTLIITTLMMNKYRSHNGLKYGHIKAMIFPGNKSRRYRQVAVLLIAGCFLYLIVTPSHWRVTVFDVGQGTSILVEGDNQNLLYDLGPIFVSGHSMTQTTVATHLTQQQVGRLDTVVISHRDADHRGDVAALLPWAPFHFINGCQSPTTVAQAAEYFAGDEFKIELIWPQTHRPAFTHVFADIQKQLSDNNLSCVIKVSHQKSGHSVLLSGDIDLKVEHHLAHLHLAGVIDLRSEILISSHHGSKNGSGFLFLRLVAPDLVIHPAGPNNRFNFPSIEARQRIAALGIRQISTSDHGQVIAHVPMVKQAKIIVRSQLHLMTPFWKRQNPFSIRAQIR